MKLERMTAENVDFYQDERKNLQNCSDLEK